MAKKHQDSVGISIVLDEDVGQLAFYHILLVNVNGYSYFEMFGNTYLKPSIHTLSGSATPRCIPTGTTCIITKITCTRKFVTPIFIIAPKWK